MQIPRTDKTAPATTDRRARAPEARLRPRLIAPFVALAAACVLIGAPPASAGVTCSYDSTLQIVNVSLTGPADVAQIGVAAGNISVLRSPGVPVSCSGGTPTVGNTGELQVDGIGAQDDTVILSDPAALVRPGGNEIVTSINLGAHSFGGDSLRLVAPDGGSSYRWGTLGINANASEAQPDVDIFYVGEEDIDAFGGTGVDTLSAAGGAGTGDPLDTSISINGGEGADMITGGAVGDFLRGREGGDSLSGGQGADLLDGGAGDDMLVGNAGTDAVRFETAMGGVVLDLGATGPQDTVSAGIDTLSGVENASGTIFADTLRGDDGPNELNGFDRSDTLVGRGGGDRLLGGFHDDSIAARDGVPDFVDCGDGTDSVEADLAGTDALTACEGVVFGAPGPVLPEPGPGQDPEPGPGPEPTSPGTGVPDTTLSFTLGGARRQRLLQQKAVRIKVTCPSEPCTVVATSSGKLRLRPLTAGLAAGTARTLKLRLTRKQVAIVRKALTTGRRPSLTVSVVARDGAGNAVQRKRRITAVR